MYVNLAYGLHNKNTLAPRTLVELHAKYFTLIACALAMNKSSFQLSFLSI